MDLAQSLSVCEKEPIHIPGSIQQHGLLFAVDDEDFKILQTSKNTIEFLGRNAEEILGHSLESVLGTPQFLSIKEQIKNTSNFQDINPILCKITVNNELKSFDVTVHRNEEQLIIFEFELSFKRDEHYINHTFFRRAQEAIMKIPHKDSILELFHDVAVEVKKITQFDRVLIYKFHEDSHGEVIAESKEQHLDPFFGLHYPASDIPAQARRMYEKNWFRIIPDVYYLPVPIIPTINPITKKPLDLSYSILRSVSPIHIEYMKNMGLEASMSISILREGKLWGLIACHHYGKKLLPYESRMACTFIGQVLSWHLVSVLENEKRREFIQRRDVMNQLIESMATSSDWMAGLKLTEKKLIEIIEGHGASIHFYNQYFQYGITPPLQDCSALHEMVEKEMKVKKQNIFYSNCISSIYSAALQFPNVVSGIMAIEMPGEPTGSLIWYRPQVEKTISWGGKPEKMEDENGKLHPRKSFSAWMETVKNTSKPWSETDRLIAEEFRNVTMETLVRHEINQFKNAEALNKKQEEFIDTICHEIRNPINGIIGSLGMIKEKLAKIKEQLESNYGIKLSDLLEVDIHLNDILECAMHQTTVTNDALDLSKLDYGKMKLESIPINLEALVQSVVKIFSNTATQKGIKLILDASEPVFLKGDPHRLKQIVINLVSNAIKFTHQGSVRVNIKEAERTEKNKIVAITIEDTGIGMTDAETLQLFNRFSQANETISARYGGSGLGLSISRKLARLMGGDVIAFSQQNIGSTFTVRISSPIPSQEEIQSLNEVPKQNLKEVPNPTESRPKKKILIVEDNILNQRILISILKKYNCPSITAQNGVEAVREYMMHSSELDAIFMDIEMPVMNGYEATKIIREKEKELQLPPIPVIGLSGNAREQQRMQAIAAGMTDYLTKPISVDDIAMKIATLLPK